MPSWGQSSSWLHEIEKGKKYMVVYRNLFVSSVSKETAVDD